MFKEQKNKSNKEKIVGQYEKKEDYFYHPEDVNPPVANVIPEKPKVKTKRFN